MSVSRKKGRGGEGERVGREGERRGGGKGRRGEGFGKDKRVEKGRESDNFSGFKFLPLHYSMFSALLHLT